MRLFVAAPYSKQVNYETGEVFPEYKAWLEEILTSLESYGHEVFSALRADNYKINDLDPASAFRLDEGEIDTSDAFIAFVNDTISAGIQTEIGMAITKGKRVVIAHLPEHKLEYFNQAIILAGQATEAILPMNSDPLA